MERNRRSDNDWLQLIQECRISGLSDTSWCHKNNIPPSSFYSAVKRLRNKACSIPEKCSGVRNDIQEVVPVSFNESVTTYSSSQALQELYSNTTIQIVVNDYKIQLTNDCAKEAIKNTLLALKEIC